MPRHGVVFPVSVTSRSSLCACRFPVDGWYTGDTRGSSPRHAATGKSEGAREARPSERENVSSTAWGMLLLKVARVQAAQEASTDTHTTFLNTHTHTHTILTFLNTQTRLWPWCKLFFFVFKRILLCFTIQKVQINGWGCRCPSFFLCPPQAPWRSLCPASWKKENK